MEWRSVGDYGQMSELGAKRLHDAIVDGTRGGRRFKLGLATGNTMVELYRLLADKLNQEHADLSQLHTYNLDEYVGDDLRAVPESHPLSYRRYMKTNFFNRLEPALGFNVAQAHFPNPQHPENFDDELETAGELDFQLLGIGFNGHIAFNEPIAATEISTEAFAALPSRVIALKELTIQTNSRLTAGDDSALVPRRAVTMGMRQILAAREILLLACFAEQTEPLGKMRRGEPTPELPASYLLAHPNASIIYTSDKIKL